MSIDTSALDFLTAGGGKSAKFETVGDRLAGTVVSATTRQQTEIGTGTPKTWDNGDPMMQLVVALQTDQRDDPQDDGIRNFYAKGSKKNPETSAGALIAALQACGPGTKLEVGGRLLIAYIGNGVPSSPGLSAPKRWAMRYEPPALGAGFLDAPEPDAAPPFDSAAAEADRLAHAAPAPQPVAAVTGDPFAGL